jgi:hypothetical protein
VMPILDFLYADHERVASFLAQLIGGDGVLTEVSAGASKSKKGGAEGKANAEIFGVGFKGSKNLTTEVQRDTRLVYDPLWNNSIKLINTISSNLIDRQKSPIEIGQLRLILGTLRVFDLSYLPKLMEAESMPHFIAAGSKNDDPDEEDLNRSDDDRMKEAKAIQAYYASLPFGIQFLLSDTENCFWFSIKRQFLSLYDLDIPLKFPSKISGNWKAIGIIDAVPDDGSIEDIEELPDNEKIHIPPYMLKMSMLPENTNEQFGRQEESYGFSPLMIYRELDF